jgi:hypothetical protein
LKLWKKHLLPLAIRQLDNEVFTGRSSFSQLINLN